MSKSKLRRIGHVYVDSGTIAIVDPAYHQEIDRTLMTPNHDDRTERLAGSEGKEFFSKGYCPIPPPGKGQGDCGVIFLTPGGDGDFTVYADIGEDGKVERVIIDFTEQDDGGS